MSTIIVRHRVADFEAWKAVYDEHGATRSQYGISDRSLHRDVDDPNTVSLILSVDDLERANAFFTSDDLRAAMERAGVVSQPDVFVTSDA